MMKLVREGVLDSLDDVWNGVFTLGGMPKFEGYFALAGMIDHFGSSCLAQKGNY